MTTTIAHLKTRLQALRHAADMLAGCGLGQGWIVQVEGVSLRGFIPCAPEDATRYSLRDALAVAAAVRNGNGATGVAVHVSHAIRAQIGAIESMLEHLQHV